MSILRGVTEDIEFLVRSEVRFQILDALRRQNMDIRGLMEELNSPRTTIQTNLKKLRCKGWIEKRNGKYSITSTGYVTVRSFADYREKVRAKEELHPFLEVLSSSEIDDLDLGCLTGSKVTTPKQGQPHAPVRRFRKLVNETDRFRGFSPVIIPSYVDIFHTQILEGMKAELIFDEVVLDAIWSEYPKQIQEVMETKRTSLLVTKEYMPYGLGITDNKILLKAYTDNEMPRCLVENGSDEAMEWVNSIYRSYKQSAVDISDMDTEERYKKT